jgi:hypothetical protein
MATESVATRPREPTLDELFCKCEQVTGVLAIMAQRQTDDSELRNALWGALSLAHESLEMVEAMLYPERNAKAA